MASLDMVILVKVGRESNLILSGAQAYRAVTVRELNKLVELYPEKHIIIIENIREKEYNGVKEFIGKCKDSKIYFYVSDNDETTCGLADELDYPIFLAVDKLYNAIEMDTGLNIGNNRTKNKMSDKQILDIEGLEGVFEVQEEVEVKQEEVEVEQEEVEVKQEEVEVKQEEVEVKALLEEIEKLKIINEAIEDDRELLKKSINSIKNISYTSEEPIGLCEYLTLSNELGELQAENSKLLKDIEDLKNSSNTVLMQDYDDKGLLDSKIKDLELECKKYKSKISELENDIKTGEKSLRDLTNEHTNLKEDMEKSAKAFEEELDSYKKKVLELESKLENADKIKEELSNKLDDAQDELDNANEEIENANQEIENAINTIDEFKVTLENLRKEKETYKESIAELNNELSELNNIKEKYTSIVEEKEQLEKLSIEQKEKIEEGSLEIDRLKGLTGDIEKQIEDAILEVQGKLGDKEREVSKLDAELALVKSKLIAKEVQYDNLVESVGLDSSGTFTVIEENKKLMELNKILKVKVSNNEREISKLEKQSEDYRLSNISLLDKNKQLGASLNALSVGITGGGSTKLPPCNYNGKGMIIPVFGSGSFGVTTTAMSIANKLSVNNKVVYVDFDMVNPKADSWFSINPIIQGLNGYAGKNLGMATGLSLFVNEGIDYFIQNANRIISRYKSSKGGSIDYISGFHTKVDPVKIVSADFSSFINYLGSSYTYVIIDFGRLGSSDIYDKVIKIISDVAYRNVAVATNDMPDVRNLFIKMKNSDININNVAWLINMSSTTALDERIKKNIGEIDYSIMPFNMDIYGTKYDFTREKLNRGKLQLFMDNILFR